MRQVFLLFIFSLALGSCLSEGETIAVPPEAPPPVVIIEEQPPAAAPEEEAFDPSMISPEVFLATKAEIQHLVENLNGIIRAKNYNAWLAYLSEEYKKVHDSPEFLDRTSKTSPRLQNQPPLQDIRDYFIRVVVPSRDHDRVDDIEFTGLRKVKAYTVNPNRSRLRLYELEYIDETWKITD